MSFKTVSGESNPCTDEMVAPWEQTKLPTILSKYDLNQIYNADEFGLFYCTESNKSLHLKNESCVGGKHSKLRLTGLTAANADGEKFYHMAHFRGYRFFPGWFQVMSVVSRLVSDSSWMVSGGFRSFQVVPVCSSFS